MSARARRKHLRVSAQLQLPLDVVTESIAILARKGGGKSYLSAVFAEEMYAAEVPFVIIDPKGDHWGLRSAADGRNEGIPVTILGGEHADVPLEPTGGKLVADLVVEHPGWYLLDVSQFASRAAEVRFAADFAERLWRAKAPRANHWPMHLFVDEADIFVPQQPRGETARCLGAYEVIGKQGRGRGIGCSFISQRAAVVNKNVLTQTEVLVVLQTTSPQDRSAVEDWFKGNATSDALKEVAGALASLPIGTAYVYSPRLLDTLEKVKVRARRTFDSGRTPKVGEKIVVPRKMAPIDLAELSEKMTETIERAKADDPKELRREIAKLRHDLRNAEIAAKLSQPTEPERIEVPVLQGKLTVLRDALDGLNRAIGRLDRWGTSLVSVLGEFHEDLARFDNAQNPVLEMDTSTGRVRPVRVANEHVAPPRRPRSGSTSNNGSLSPAKHRILNALAWLETIGVDEADKTQLAFLADQSPRSSGYTNNLGALRTAGLIDYPGPGRVVLTEQGRALADVGEAPASDDELHAMIFSKLSPAKGRILRALIEAYPNELTKAELAERADQSATSSGYTNNLGALRSLGLIDYPAPGHVVGLPILFLGERTRA